MAIGLPLIGAGVMAGLSLLGSAEQNSQAKAQYEAQIKNIRESLVKQYGQIQQQANEENRNIALEMASQRFQGLVIAGNTASALTERALAGNLAGRLLNNTAFKATMKQNALRKAAEDSMASYGSAMEAKRDEARQAMFNAATQLSSNQVSTLGAISGAIGAGIGGYMMGSALSSSLGGLGSLGSKAITSGGSFINSQTLTAQSTLPSGGGTFINPNSLTATSFFR